MKVVHFPQQERLGLDLCLCLVRVSQVAELVYDWQWSQVSVLVSL